MIIPKHVLDMAERAEEEIRRQMAGSWKLEKIKKIRKQLKVQSGYLFENEDDYINSLNIIDAIICACNELTADACKRVFNEVTIDPELVWALNHALILHPEMKQEIETVLEFIEDVPNSCWCQADEYDNFKVFKLVRSAKSWENIMEKYSGKNLGIGMSFLDDFKYIKIGYVPDGSTKSRLSATVKKAKRYLIKKLGITNFEYREDAFELWFRVGITGTYYIYVPK